MNHNERRNNMCDKRNDAAYILGPVARLLEESGLSRRSTKNALRATAWRFLRVVLSNPRLPMPLSLADKHASRVVRTLVG